MDGVCHQVASHVIDFITAVVPPVLVTNGAQIPHGLSAIWLLIQLLHLTCMLLPAVQSEAVNLHTIQSQSIGSSSKELCSQSEPVNPHTIQSQLTGSTSKELYSQLLPSDSAYTTADCKILVCTSNELG